MIRRWWPLGLVATVVATLALAGVIPRWPGLVGHVALPPLDLFADVRVLAVRAPTPLTFVVGLVLALLARVTLLTLLVRRTRSGARFALGFYGIALPFALLATTLDVAGRAVLYAYLLWAGLVVTLVSYFALAAVPWTGCERLRDAFASVMRRGAHGAVLLGYVVALGLVAVVARRPGDPVQVVVVPVAAALTGLTAARLGAPLEWSPRARALAAVGALVVVAVVVVAVVGTSDDPGPARPASRRGSLLLVAGVDTSSGSGALFRLRPSALGYSCAQTFYYSYAGRGPGAAQKGAACPIRTGAPYRRGDTVRPLGPLAATFRRQLADLPRPVTVVTHSQGAWVAWAGLAGRRDAGADALVMLGPFPESLVAYPPPGRSGRGIAAGVAVRAVTDVARSIGVTRFDPDAPLARELQASPGAVEAVFAEPLPGSTHVGAVFSRWDLPLVARALPDRVTTSCPGWSPHGGLPSSGPTLAAARSILGRTAVPGCPWWSRAFAHAVEAFGAPPSPG